MLDKLITKYVSKDHPVPDKGKILARIRENNMELAKAVAARYGRGNVLLQQAKIQTKKELEDSLK